jgi:hypothetical protein
VLRSLDPIPPCTLVGGFWGPAHRTDPADLRFADIADLVAVWPGADLAGKARLASLSAERCRALRGPMDDPMPALAQGLGALGHARAHTGPARALIFAPDAAAQGAEQALVAAGLTGVFRFASGGGA